MARRVNLERLSRSQRVRKGRKSESRKGIKARDKAANIIYWS